MKIRNDGMRQNVRGILREQERESGKEGYGREDKKKKGRSEEEEVGEGVRGEQGKEGAWLGVLGCLMDEGVVGLVGAVSPE